jgi:hypothetical protein
VRKSPARTAPDRDAIVAEPRWDDGLVHCWTLAQRRRSLAWAITMLATVLAIPTGLLLTCVLVGLALPAAAAALAAVLVAFFVLRYILEVVRVLLGKRVSVVRRAMARNRFLLAASALGGWVYLMVGDAPALGRAFSADGSLVPVLDWVRFLGGEVADIVLLDIPEALGWTESAIEPHGTVAIWALGGFRLLVGIGVIELAVRVWERFVSGATFYATVPDTWGRAAADLDPAAVLTWHGVVRPDGAPVSCTTTDFSTVLGSYRATSDPDSRAFDEREDV